MDFEVEYTPEQEAFREEVRRWFQENTPDGLEFPFNPADLSQEQYLKRRDLGRRLGEMGWLYPSAPMEYGGGGLALDKVIILEEEIQRIGLELPPYYDSGGRMGAPSILVWGTDDQKERFLPPIYRGEVRTWQLLTEPGAGSDLAGVQTTAIRDGDDYVINGQKVFVGSNHGAEQSWMICVTDPEGDRHQNLSWLMVPMDLPGITVVPLELLTAGREGGAGSGTKNTVFFDDVRVPATNLVGGENNGWRVASTHLEVEHGGTGRIRRNKLIDQFFEYCRNAERGGKALTDDPDAREGLVEIFIESEITRLFGMRNYWLAGSDADRSYEGAQYSLQRKQSGLRIAELMLDVLGPYALISDEEWGPLSGALELYQREAIVALHPGATSDIQKVVMSRRIGIGREIREKAGTLR